MTAAAKAKELVGKYLPITNRIGETAKGAGHYAKQCALICCDEIIDVVTDAYIYLGRGEIGLLEHYIPYEFWQTVKEEIKKLKV